jgi:SAM-dependent methyltransferase
MTPHRRDNVINNQIPLISKLVPQRARFAELGAGDCELSLRMCNHCASVTAIDVTDALVPHRHKPSNFTFVKIDGLHLPFDDHRFDFIFSDQLMEHLHPDDGAVQLSEVYRILAPGGAYYCITPNVTTGPHDISVYFDDIARGFHLKEYSYRELSNAFTAAGFRRQVVILGLGNNHILVSATIALAMETCARAICRVRKRRSITGPLLRHLMGIRLLGYKTEGYDAGN